MILDGRDSGPEKRLRLIDWSTKPRYVSNVLFGRSIYVITLFRLECKVRDVGSRNSDCEYTLTRQSLEPVMKSAVSVF